MKKTTLYFSLVLLALSAAGPSLGAPPSREAEKHNQWLFQCLTEIQKINVGTTRKEVDKLFMPRGGLQAMNPVVLVYRKSPYIFVRVSFKSKRDAKGREMSRSATDKVASISRPYLEHWQIVD